jgi:hypothetical protein
MTHTANSPQADESVAQDDKTITLKFPLTVNGEKVSVLELPERIQIRHLRAMDQAPGEIGKVAALIGAMTNLPKSAVDQIDAEDFGTIAEKMNGFLSLFPSTGGM